MEKKKLKHNNKAILSEQDPDVKLRSLSQRVVTAIPESNTTSSVKKFMLFSFLLFSYLLFSFWIWGGLGCFLSFGIWLFCLFVSFLAYGSCPFFHGLQTQDRNVSVNHCLTKSKGKDTPQLHTAHLAGHEKRCDVDILQKKQKGQM